MAEGGEDALNPKGKRYVAVKERPIFTSYIMPNGYLTLDMACHALWRYYLSARLTYENDRDNITAYEGDRDSGVNYRQLFKSIAGWYDVTPERMAKFWSNVDMQCVALGLPKMPDSAGYRFNRVVEVKS